MMNPRGKHWSILKYSLTFLVIILLIIQTGGPTSFALAQTPPTGTPGLVAYYTFDGDTRDYSGNGNHGTSSGAIFVAGKKGQALKFNGVNDYVSAPVNINPAVMPQMTMVAWVKADKVTGTVISNDNGDFDRTIAIDDRGGGTGWSAFSGSGGVLGYRPVTIGEWVFIAAVYDQNAKKVRLHVDDAVYEKTGTLGSGLNYINIGRNPSFGLTLAGTIDEVRIYNYALSPGEIASLRAEAGQTPAPTSTSIVVNGDFEDPSVSSTFVTRAAGQTFGGWTVDSGSVDHISGYWQAASGRQSVDLSGDSAGTIHQDLTTAPGQTYILRFAMAGNPAGTAVKQMEVLWGAASVDKLSFDTTGRSTSNMGWQEREYTVAATAGVTRLTFRGLTAGASGAALDNVRVIASSALPLPASTPTGLVGYWKLDETSGNVAADSSGLGNNGTVKGTPSWTPSGRVGGALSFDGKSSYVVTPVTFNQLSNGMTLMAWARHDDPSMTWSWVFSEDSDADAHSQMGKVAGSGWPTWQIQGVNNIVATGVNIADSQWHHIAGVWEKGVGLSLYIDGVLKASGSFTGALTAKKAIRIGAKNDSYAAEKWKGAIDEARIYNRALSQSEIQETSGAPSSATLTPPPTVTPAPAPAITPIPALRQTDASLIAESRVAASGGTVTAPVRLERASKVGSLNFSISYDPQVLKVVRVDGGDLGRGALFQANTRDTGIIRFGVATQGTEGVTGDGPVAHIVFTVVGAAVARSSLTLGDLLVTDTSGARLGLKLQNGSITIGTKVKGDYDGDGRLTAKDALAALKMSVRDLPEDLNLDMDNDGRVSSEDARRILAAALSGQGTPVSSSPTPSAKNQSERESELISNLGKASKTPAKVRMENGIARTVLATLPVPPSAGDKPEDKARAIMEEYKDLYGLDNVKAELAVADVFRTGEGKDVVSFQRMAGNVPVFASSVNVHISPNNAVTYISAGLPRRVDVAAEPKLSRDEAVLRARNAAQVGDDAQALETRLVVFNEGIITGESTRSVLTWMVTLDISDPPGELVSFVDAVSGEVVSSYDDLQDALDRRTYTALNKEFKAKITAGDAQLWFTEDGQVQNVQPSADGRKAYDFAGKIYNYFKNTFGRDSYDGKGARIRSFVHYGPKTGNAFWSRQLNSMFFMNDMVFMDVFAHEFTHAVTSSTAGLVYQGASGALNESFSDVFAAFIDDWAGEGVAWEIGEGLKGGAIRSLKDPPSIKRKDGVTYPTHMTLAPKYLKTNQDHGGVHTNSSIPNYVAYLLVNGGEHPTSKIKVNGIGRAKAEQLYYKVLTERYLEPASDFLSLSSGMTQACEELRKNNKFSFGYRDCGRVLNALAAVGLNEKDTDEDSWQDFLDNCPDVYNPEQEDKDGNGVGDACEAGTVTGVVYKLQSPPAVSQITKPTAAGVSATISANSATYTNPDTGVGSVTQTVSWEVPQELQPGRSYRIAFKSQVAVTKLEWVTRTVRGIDMGSTVEEHGWSRMEGNPFYFRIFTDFSRLERQIGPATIFQFSPDGGKTWRSPKSEKEAWDKNYEGAANQLLTPLGIWSAHVQRYSPPTISRPPPLATPLQDSSLDFRLGPDFGGPWPDKVSITITADATDVPGNGNTPLVKGVPGGGSLATVVYTYQKVGR